jgi:molybdopterin-guanine dinucleotide biosynthesis protein A
LKVPVIADPPDVQRAARREGRRLGPLAGILAGMEWAQRYHPHVGWILTAPADVPFLPLDLTVRLCGLMHVPEPDVLMVRTGRHRESVLAVWSVTLAGDLRRALLQEGVRRVEDFARRHRCAELSWAAGRGAFLNINTPDDLATAETQLLRRSNR